MAHTDGSLKLDQLVGKVSSLYTLPAVAVEVLRLTSHPQVDVHQIQLCIEKDPALTSRILRVVNSSLFGLGRHVSSLNQALALLGIKPLKLLVLGFNLPSELFVGVAGDLLGRFWRRTLTKAVAARELSETIWKIPGDEAFLAGLLQNIGMLALIQELGQPYLEVLETALCRSSDVGATEAKSLGFTHYEFSARLLERWGLPANLVSIVGIGSSPERIDALQPLDRSLPQILHLAEILSSVLAESRADLLPILMRFAIRYCNLTHPQLLQLVVSLEDKVQHFAAALNLEVFNGSDFTDIVVAAQAQMSVVAADAASDLIRAYRFIESSAETEQTNVDSDPPALTEARVSGNRSAAVDGLPASPLTLREQLWTDGAAAHSKPNHAAASQAAGTLAKPNETPAQKRPVKPPGSIADMVERELLILMTCIVTSCRQSREPVSLMLISAKAPESGPLAKLENFDIPIAEIVRQSCREAGLSRGVCRAVGADRLALLPGTQRREAASFGNQFIQELSDQSLLLSIQANRDSQSPVAAMASGQDTAIKVCIGLAAIEMPPKNLVLREWITRAERCLKAVEQTGAGGLKSIEIY